MSRASGSRRGTPPSALHPTMPGAGAAGVRRLRPLERAQPGRPDAPRGPSRRAQLRDLPGQCRTRPRRAGAPGSSRSGTAPARWRPRAWWSATTIRARWTCVGSPETLGPVTNLVPVADRVARDEPGLDEMVDGHRRPAPALARAARCADLAWRRRAAGAAAPARPRLRGGGRHRSASGCRFQSLALRSGAAAAAGRGVRDIGGRAGATGGAAGGGAVRHLRPAEPARRRSAAAGAGVCQSELPARQLRPA